MTSAGTGITAVAEDNAYLEFKLRPGEDIPRIKMTTMSNMDVTRASVDSTTTDIRKVQPPSKTGYELRVPYSSVGGESRITTAMTKKAGIHKHRATGKSGFHYFNLD